MKETHYIHPDYLDLEKLREITGDTLPLALSEASKRQIEHCRQYLERKIAERDDLYYGINTGFGSLCDIEISRSQTIELQQNLVKSHACGTGEEVPGEIVRLMLLLKIQSLAYGYSGVRLKLVERLIDFYNMRLNPVIYQQGSLGASGDLAPLAHLSLPLIGLGKVDLDGQRMDSRVALEKLGLAPLELQAKEGLALLNGTQFSTAYAVWCLIKSRKLLRLANVCAALSTDAFDCKLSPYQAPLHRVRPHPGQIAIAASIRHWLAGSELAQNVSKKQVQDPYAFRCIPQVHGASLDTVNYVERVVMTEVNGVTDNPNIFPDEDLILSGGNFHGQPIALALDFLAIALAELGSISERRIFQLISGSRGLPKFLTPSAGLHSGMMIPQYTAASIVSQNKQLCTPASVDSIVSSNGQEDHVSMSANAATKAYRVVENLQTILAIEFMTAAQALEFRKPLRTAPALERLLGDYRAIVSPLHEDRVLSDDIRATITFVDALHFPEIITQ